jgi:hypothetical protein
MKVPSKSPTGFLVPNNNYLCFIVALLFSANHTTVAKNIVQATKFSPTEHQQ